MIKSALLYNYKDMLHFLVFAEDHLTAGFNEKLSDWRSLLPEVFDFELLPLQFPSNSDTEWRTLFKPCAAQRLFLPVIYTIIHWHKTIMQFVFLVLIAIV